MSTNILQEQIQYYCERASEYDEWFLRQGRYNRGQEHRQQWFSEVAEVEAALNEARPSGDILELACGTGLWTEHLLPFATHVTAVDASPEVIALNQHRVNSESVQYIVADLFNWMPLRKFDFVFFGFWLSHVPMELFAAFWQMVRASVSKKSNDGTIYLAYHTSNTLDKTFYTFYNQSPGAKFYAWSLLSSYY